LTGREDILEQLRATLARQRTVALVGMPGVGKTQTAIEFAHRHRTEYAAVLWARANSRELLISDYLSLALMFDLERDERDQELVVAAVLGWFRRTSGWLLIVDGADKPSGVQDLLPTAGPGRLLLTTQDPAVSSIATPLEVGKLERAEGARLMLRRAGLLTAEATLEQVPDEVSEAALAISDAVDGLPLALDQAGAYIVECGVDPAEYRELYEAKGEELRQQHPEFRKLEQPTVTTTFSLVFAEVEKTSPETAEFLRLCASLGPEPIPEEIFLDGAPELGERLSQACATRLALLDTIRPAYRMSLLLRSPGSRTVRLHRPVRDGIRDLITTDRKQDFSELAAIAVRAVGRAFPAVTPATWPACERLLPHALSCFAAVERWDIRLLEAGRLLNRTAYYLIERARYDEAKPLLHRALQTTEEIQGRDHPDTMRTRHTIARWTAEVGDSREALRLFRELLPAQVGVLGPDDPDTLLTRHQIAFWTGEAGNLGEALRQCRELLQDQERVLGSDHPDALLTRRNIARWTGEAGDAREALHLFRELLPAQKRVQGSQHPDTLLTRHDIAHWTGEAGNSREALRLCLELLPDRVQVHGSDHPAVLGTRHSIAYWTGEAGNPGEARQLLLKLLPDRERMQGREHPDTLITRRDIARWTGEAGDPREAARLLVELLPDQEHVQGPDHPDTLGMRRSTADWTGEAGEAREALRLLNELLPDQERVQGTDHPDTLLTRDSIAYWTGKAGKPCEALRLFRELLPVQERVRGPDHPDSLKTRRCIAHWTGECGTREALRLCRELLPTQEHIQGPDHPDTLRTRQGIAYWTGEVGEPNEALRLCDDLLAALERVLGSEHPATLETRRLIARLEGMG
jgi:hypothetical protein